MLAVINWGCALTHNNNAGEKWQPLPMSFLANPWRRYDGATVTAVTCPRCSACKLHAVKAKALKACEGIINIKPGFHFMLCIKLQGLTPCTRLFRAMGFNSCTAPLPCQFSPRPSTLPITYPSVCPAGPSAVEKYSGLGVGGHTSCMHFESNLENQVFAFMKLSRVATGRFRGQEEEEEEEGEGEGEDGAEEAEAEEAEEEQEEGQATGQLDGSGVRPHQVAR
jgi:hypothetical protein